MDYLRQRSAQKQLQNQKSIEELYAQPISKRPHQSPQRPNHLELKGPLNRPAPAKAHLPGAYAENIATIIDPTYAQLQPPRSNNNNHVSGGHNNRGEYYHDEYLEDSGSPPSPLPPPYMPIQGMRRQLGYQEGSALNAAREMAIPQNYSRMADPKGGGGGGLGGAGAGGKAKKNREKCAQQ